MPGSTIFIKRDAVFQKCPDCRTAGYIRASRSRNLIETIVKKITFFKIYRCKKCGWRGYKSSIVLTSESFKTLLMYLFVALICAYAVKFIIKKFL